MPSDRGKPQCYCQSLAGQVSLGADGFFPQAAQREEQLGQLKKAAKETFFSASPALNSVEQRIRGKIAEQESPFGEIATYLLDLGGKRIRPLLAILCARLYRMHEPTDQLIDVAAGVELVHMATLLHDDIIDQSPTRRNKTSAFAKFGIAPTLLAGDFLLARAFGLCTNVDSFVIRETEHACVALSEGELLEGYLDSGRTLVFDDYVEIVSKKTAALFALASLSGAHIAGAEMADVERMRRFGLGVGVAFQMIDDILDVTADEDLLGKPAGTDLRQRTPSLVNVMWLASGDRQATEFFGNTSPGTQACRDAVAYLKSSMIIAQCRAFAQERAEKAKESLVAANGRDIDETARAQLLSIVDYTIERGL
jgi:octaprenyl-diphosphate synthase